MVPGCSSSLTLNTLSGPLVLRRVSALVSQHPLRKVLIGKPLLRLLITNLRSRLSQISYGTTCYYTVDYEIQQMTTDLSTPAELAHTLYAPTVADTELDPFMQDSPEPGITDPADLTQAITRLYQQCLSNGLPEAYHAQLRDLLETSQRCLRSEARCRICTRPRRCRSVSSLMPFRLALRHALILPHIRASYQRLFPKLEA